MCASFTNFHLCNVTIGLRSASTIWFRSTFHSLSRGPSDRKPGIVPPIRYKPPLTLTAPPITFLRTRGYGRSRFSRKQLHNVRMDTLRLENLVRVEVCMTCHVQKLGVGIESGLTPCLFQQGRCKVESDEECQVWWGAVAGEPSRAPILLFEVPGFIIVPPAGPILCEFGSSISLLGRQRC